MKLKLNTLQRIKLFGVVAGKQRADNVALNRALKIIDKLDFSDDEEEQIELVRAGNQYSWKDQTREWEIEFSSKQAAMITEDVKPGGGTQWSAAEARPMKSVFAQLNIDLGDDDGDKEEKDE